MTDSFGVFKLRPSYDESYPPTEIQGNARYMPHDFSGHEWINSLPRKCEVDIHPIFLKYAVKFTDEDIWKFSCFPHQRFSWTLRCRDEKLHCIGLQSTTVNSCFDTLSVFSREGYSGKSEFDSALFIASAPEERLAHAIRRAKVHTAYSLYQMLWWTKEFDTKDWYYNDNEALKLMWDIHTEKIFLD